MRPRGEGLSTGDRYEFNNAIENAFSRSLVNGQYAETFTGNTVVLGDGASNNLFSPITIHLTVNAYGEVTAEVARFDCDCK